MPTELHDVLIERAAAQGVSLNTLIVALLAGGVGFKLKENPEMTKQTEREAFDSEVLGCLAADTKHAVGTSTLITSLRRRGIDASTGRIVAALKRLEAAGAVVVVPDAASKRYSRARP